MRKKQVVWTAQAAESLQKYCDFIAHFSKDASIKVKKGILNSTAQLSSQSEIYQLDEFRKDSQRNIRRFFRWSYKIVYEVFDDEVVILDIFHTSQDSFPNEK